MRYSGTVVGQPSLLGLRIPGTPKYLRASMPTSKLWENGMGEQMKIAIWNRGDLAGCWI